MFIVPEDCIEIGQHLGDILIQVSAAMDGFKSRIAL